MNNLMKYEEIDGELQIAIQKHPNWPKDLFIQHTILAEEVGEVAKAILHLKYEDGTVQGLYKEILQSAAMCMRMLDYLQVQYYIDGGKREISCSPMYTTHQRTHTGHHTRTVEIGSKP